MKEIKIDGSTVEFIVSISIALGTILVIWLLLRWIYPYSRLYIFRKNLKPGNTVYYYPKVSKRNKTKVVNFDCTIISINNKNALVSYVNTTLAGSRVRQKLTHKRIPLKYLYPIAVKLKK